MGNILHCVVNAEIKVISLSHVPFDFMMALTREGVASQQKGTKAMINKVVIHSCQGDITKGETSDFFPNKDVFHLKKENAGALEKIHIKDLKAVFFVKDFTGNAAYTEKNDVERVGLGRKIKVQFKDSETLTGYTQGYAPNRPGFFVVPCDPDSNNLRVFVVAAATAKVEFV